MLAQRKAIVVGLVAVALTASVTAQTVIRPPENKYSPADDVKLGQEAAQEVERQLPVMHDDNVNTYLDDIGRRLVNAIPSDLQHPEFRYTFKGVNVKEINAFALPGGPMFINRGMMEKAHTEGEIAGVMAHELSHVALRHGTAQQTKATPYAVGRSPARFWGRSSAVARVPSSHKARSSVSARPSCDSVASSSDRPTCSEPTSWRAPGTTRAIWPMCSGRSRRRAARADRSG